MRKQGIASIHVDINKSRYASMLAAYMGFNQGRVSINAIDLLGSKQQNIKRYYNYCNV